MSLHEDNVNLLKRVREMCLQGQAAGAELELYSVHRRAGCPACVKVALAALLARRGNHKDARAVLRDVKPDSVRQSTHEEVRLTISILISLGTNNEAEQLARAYHNAYGRQATTWLRDMSAPGAHELRWSPTEPVDELARDLAQEPKAIPTLVYAQQHKRDLPTIALLRNAIRRIVPLFENDPMQMAMVCRAMAELCELAGDSAQAQRWAHRGLEEDPYCAPLALLINRLRDDGRTTLPPRSVLVCVATKHPTYPDVQAALIRRENTEGRADEARERLAAWLEREPYSPHALELRKEIAA
jgi:thioredoxin-like negative regulator of GroEL